MNKTTAFLDNGHGWELAVECFRGPRSDPGRRPVLMVPGYAMNTFILSYHPRGRSMIEYLVDAGFEVWAANLRGQGASRRVGPKRRFGLAELALDDLPAVLAHVREHTCCQDKRIDAIGCSLGASFVYGYLAHHRDDHGLGCVVSIGGPLRWNEVHPLLGLAFRSPCLAGAVPIKGTRALARRVLPVVRRFPAALSLYMNAEMIDLSKASDLVNTTDDPIRYVNKQIALWVRNKDLVLRGVNVVQALSPLRLPVLCVLASADGIVPVPTALSIRDAMPDARVDVLQVGDEQTWFAHADLFISNEAEARVFEPLARWLEAHN